MLFSYNAVDIHIVYEPGSCLFPVMQWVFKLFMNRIWKQFNTYIDIFTVFQFLCQSSHISRENTNSTSWTIWGCWTGGTGLMLKSTFILKRSHVYSSRGIRTFDVTCVWATHQDGAGGLDGATRNKPVTTPTYQPTRSHSRIRRSSWWQSYDRSPWR